MIIFELIIIIIQQAFIHLPVIIGAYISMSLMKTPDLSLESAYVFGALVAAKVVILCQGQSLWITLICSVVASLIGGALVGLTSSMLTQKARLPHLLSSIITFGIFHGINQLVAECYISLSGYSNPLTIFSFSSRYPELLVLLFISLLLVIAAYFFLKTQLSYALTAYGYNPIFLKNYDISIYYVFTLGIIISNALAGLGGYLFAQSNGFADINMGAGKVLLCITALILGKAIAGQTSTVGIRYSVIGIISYFALQQLLLKIGFDLKYFTMIQSLLILMVLITMYKKQGGRKLVDHLGV